MLWEHWHSLTIKEVDFEELVGEFDEDEGVINLYGPPSASTSSFGNPLVPIQPPTMDTTPGHPPRQLADFPYPRLAPKP